MRRPQAFVCQELRGFADPARSQQCLLRQKFAPPDAGASRLESTWGASRVEPPDALGRIEFVLIYGGAGATKA